MCFEVYVVNKHRVNVFVSRKCTKLTKTMGLRSISSFLHTSLLKRSATAALLNLPLNFGRHGLRGVAGGSCEYFASKVGGNVKSVK